MRDRRGICLAKNWLLLLAIVLTGTALLPSSSQAALPRQVLVLHSYHLGYKWTDEMTQGITAALRDEGKAVQIRYEFMDTKRVADTAYFELLYATYRHKYRSATFEVIIATDNDAFAFLKRYRDPLFPGTPVVFCGVNNFEPAQLEGQLRFTGVNETADLKATLDLALRLHPATRQIVVINDQTTTGRIVHAELERLIPAYRSRVEFLFLEELELPEIIAAVQKLGPESLVFFGLFFRDKAGRFYEYDEAITRITRSSPVPVYGAWDFFLGYGLTGGMLTSGYLQGETAGRMALRILHGEKVEDLPIVMQSPSRYMFDYAQLQRFRIDTTVLPAESIVINRPSFFYSVPRQVIWGGIAALAGSLLAISFLLYHSAIRRRTEGKLRDAAVKYRIVADNTYNWEFWLDPQGRFLYTSPSCQRITGHPAEAFQADPGLLQRLIHPDDAGLFAGHRHDITRKPLMDELEFRIVLADGETRWIHHVCLPVFDDNGTFLGTRASNSDITEQKRAERLLLENARINRELEIAQEVQQSFLSACPTQLPGLLMACCCTPAAHVGGDYYDFFTPAAGLVDLVIADITGHSLAAALLMTETRSVLHARVGADRAPGALLGAVNDLLHDDLCRAELQISMFYARLETENRTLTYANAGHNRPFLYRAADGVLVELDADGLLLGIMPKVRFEELRIGVEPGDILLLYTDGVTEAENPQEEAFGAERLGALIAAQSWQHPREIVDAILAELAAFSGAKPRDDDVAMIAIKIT